MEAKSCDTVTVYLAGPIFYRTDEDAKGWRNRVKEAFVDDENIVINDPTDWDFRGSEDENYAEIVETDKQMIDESDIILVYFDKPSVGTSMEALYSWERGRAVLVVPATRETRISPWLRYHSSLILHRLEDAILVIRATQEALRESNAARRTVKLTV